MIVKAAAAVVATLSTLVLALATPASATDHHRPKLGIGSRSATASSSSVYSHSSLTMSKDGDAGGVSTSVCIFNRNTYRQACVSFLAKGERYGVENTLDTDCGPNTCDVTVYIVDTTAGKTVLWPLGLPGGTEYQLDDLGNIAEGHHIQIAVCLDEAGGCYGNSSGIS